MFMHVQTRCRLRRTLRWRTLLFALCFVLTIHIVFVPVLLVMKTENYLTEKESNADYSNRKGHNSHKTELRRFAFAFSSTWTSRLSNIFHSEKSVEHLQRRAYSKIAQPWIMSNRSVDSGPARCRRCFLTDYTMLIQPNNLCDGNRTRLVVVITSPVYNVQSRNIIRETWVSSLKSANLFIEYVFLVGKGQNITAAESVEKIVNESKLHEDIVMFDFVDSYENLTIKTIVGFKYTWHRCQTAEYIMKTDEDVYVNIPAVLKLLLRGEGKNMHFGSNRLEKNSFKANPSDFLFAKNAVESHIRSARLGQTFTRKSMYGLLWHESQPIRNNSSMFRKWAVTKEEYPRDYYPDYLDGHAYIIAMDIVKGIINVSENVPFFKFEDVYVGLCLEELGYRVTSSNGFLRTRNKITPCSHKLDSVYTVHGVEAEKMVEVWKSPCSRKGYLEFEHLKNHKQWIRLNIDHH